MLPRMVQVKPSHRLLADGVLASMLKLDIADASGQITENKCEAEPLLVNHMRCSSSLQLIAHCACPSLLQLPVDALEQVFKHLAAQQLAQGLSQACCLLYHMQLPHIIMNPLLPREDYSIVSC